MTGEESDSSLLKSHHMTYHIWASRDMKYHIWASRDIPGCVVTIWPEESPASKEHK